MKNEKRKVYEIVHRFGATSLWDKDKNASVTPVEATGYDMCELFDFTHLGSNLEIDRGCPEDLPLKHIVDTLNSVSRIHAGKELHFDSWHDGNSGDDDYFVGYYVYAVRDETDEEYKVRIDKQKKLEADKIEEKARKKEENLQKRLKQAQELLAKNHAI